MLKELKLEIFKLLKKIPKAKEINLNFLKNYLKAIKEEFKENKMNFSYNFINWSLDKACLKFKRKKLQTNLLK